MATTNEDTQNNVAMVGGTASFVAAPENPTKNRGWLTRPDGTAEPDGPRAWSVAFGSFCAGLACMGQLYSGGIFVQPLIKEYNSGLSETSLVVTLGLAMFYVVGLFATHLADHFGVRRVTFAGAIVWNLGWIFGSVSNQLWQSLLSQAILSGTGVALVYWPMVSILPQWFKKYRATAMGLAVLGSGVGSIIISFAGQSMIESLGWRNALRVIGGFGAFLLIIAVLLVERRVAFKRSPRGVFHGILLSIRELMQIFSVKLFLLSVLFFQFSFFVPYTFLPSYAIHLGLSSSFSAFSLAMLGIGSAVGRLVFGPIADKMGRLGTYRVNMLLATVTLASWAACTTESSILAFAFFYGAFGGGFAAMFAVVAAELWGPERLSAVFTMVNLVCIPGAFASGPAIGAIIQDSGYGAAIGVTAGMMGMALLWILPVRKPKRMIQSEAPKMEHLPMSSSQHPEVSKNEPQQDQPSLPADELLLTDAEAAVPELQLLMADLEKFNIDASKVDLSNDQEVQRLKVAVQYLNFRKHYPEPPPEDVFTKVMDGLKEYSFDTIKQKVYDKFGAIPAEWQYTELH